MNIQINWRKWRISSVLMAGLLVGATVLGGCGLGDKSGDSGKGGLPVVATVYPAYDIAKQVGGDKVNVSLLVPPGTEPHDWEPTVKDLKAVGQAKVFIYNGAGLEPSEKLLAPDNLKEAKPVELAKSVEVMPIKSIDIDNETETETGHDHDHHTDAAHHDDDGHDHHHHGTVDPHIWLNPMNVAKEVDAVVAAFSEADPANKDHYEANGKAYKEKLTALDAQYQAFAQTIPNKDLVVTHEAFGYFANRYGFTQLGIMGVAPDAEPTPERMASIISFVKAHKVKAIFSEELVNPKLAEAIAKETGTKVYMLNPVEGLTEEQMKAGTTYLSVMEDNLKVLKTALGGQ